MKTAFLFPGQGAQIVGMGKDVAADFPVAAQIYEKANDVLGFDVCKICFEGPQEQLNTTTISQPAIFTTSAAILEVIRTESATASLVADVTAGLSMGEYTALYAAGLISFEDGLLLVKKRGEAMQAAAEATEGSMVSIIGLDEDKVGQLCEKAGEGQVLCGVNFNCPGQIVISGERQACQRAGQLAAEFGAIKAVPLAVAGAFHTELMKLAADALEYALGRAQIKDSDKIKVIANINADYYKNAETIRAGLVKQLTGAILWQKCMERLLADGVEDFYEIGPNRVLTGLMKRINRKTKVTNLSTAEAIKGLLKK
ncbi:MAG: ACP S-malonyltransferase [Phycisphaerae bacterium]|nr:ACP S-malonyltransferase [Phycisphaerae bacterium]